MSFLDLRLKHIESQTTYSFTFIGCDSTFEWTAGDSEVLETQSGVENRIPIDCACKDNLKSVIRCVKKAKETGQ